LVDRNVVLRKIAELDTYLAQIREYDGISPEQYRKVLLENNVIDAELFSLMERMAKFRNIVVHQYETVDAGIVTGILRKNLSDFSMFREKVLAYLKD